MTITKLMNIKNRTYYNDLIKRFYFDANMLMLDKKHLKA